MISKLNVKVKVILIICIVLLLGAEWVYYTFNARFNTERIPKEITDFQKDILFFSVMGFMLFIFIFKSLLFIHADLELFYQVPAIGVYILGLVILGYGLLKYDIPYIQSSSFLTALPSLFMSVIIFREILIKKNKEKGEEYEETNQ